MLKSVLESEVNTQVILCQNADEAGALRKAGFRSIRVVSDDESIFVKVGDQWEIDPDLRQFARFILAFNRGAEALRDRVAMSLDDVRCTWVEWPEEIDGPANCLANFGAEELENRVRSGRPMWVDEVCTLHDIPEEPETVGYRTGFDMLDKHGFRLVRPAFMPVIGPYGSGKSVLLRQLAVNLWKLHGWRTLVTAFEEKIKPRYVRDLRRHLALANGGHSMHDIDGLDAEINAAFRFLRRRRGDMMDVDRLIDRIAYAAKVYGVDVVIIDPVNEIDHHVPKGMSKTDYMGEFIMRLKQLADDYGLLMICAAHPPKDGVAKRSGARIYTLNDGADTAHYGNKADIGWCVWRPTMDGPTYLNIDKCKDQEVMGKPELCKLSFNPHQGRFTVTRMGYDLIVEMEQ